MTIEEREELLNALEVLRRVCAKYNCNKCPLSNIETDVCELTEIEPERWRFNGTEDDWKAMRN